MKIALDEDALQRDPTSTPRIPADLDPECVKLFEALNRLEGITTTGSCCGHDRHPYWFLFQVRNLSCAGLSMLLRAIDPRYGACMPNLRGGWQVALAQNDLPECPSFFCLQGNVGSEYGDILANKLMHPCVGDRAWLQVIREARCAKNQGQVATCTTP